MRTRLLESGAKLLEWSPHTSGTLRGFCRVRFPDFVEVDGISVHISGSRMRCSPPSRAWVVGGELMRDADGKPRYTPMLSFATPGVRRNWSNMVIAALRADQPDLFEALDAEMAS